MTKKVRSQGKCVNWSPIDISWMMHSGCSQEPFPLKHCTFYTMWVYLLCLHNMGTVAVETERCIIRPGMTDTPPPAGVLSTTTHPSDPRGWSSGTQAGKWVLLLVCDLSALFRHSSLRSSDHTAHLVICALEKSSGFYSFVMMPNTHPGNPVSLHLFYRLHVVLVNIMYTDLFFLSFGNVGTTSFNGLILANMVLC